MELGRCYIGDCRERMAQMAAAGVRAQTCVTSPPYWGLRDYGVEEQIGLEPTLDEWVANLVEVCRAVRDVLADDGTLWLNLGDSYAGNRSYQVPDSKHRDVGNSRGMTVSRRRDDAAIPRSDLRVNGLKPKDLIGQPWRVAFALQADGWYLRRDIIWHKPNPMPESCKDRPTTSHEYVFLLTKAERYFYDADAIKEPASPDTHARYARGRSDNHKWADGGPGNQTIARSFEHMRARKLAPNGSGTKNNSSFDEAMAVMPDERNKRSVWTVATEAFSGAHFATFPRKLIEPCILAGSRKGDVVLDPFMGSGTTAQVAEALGRQWIGCELQPDYLPLIESRLQQMVMAL